MLKNDVTKSNGFRALNPSELEAVAGGEGPSIIVTAPSPSSVGNVGVGALHFSGAPGGIFGGVTGLTTVPNPFLDTDTNASDEVAADIVVIADIYQEYGEGSAEWFLYNTPYSPFLTPFMAMQLSYVGPYVPDITYDILLGEGKENKDVTENSGKNADGTPRVDATNVTEISVDVNGSDILVVADKSDISATTLYNIQQKVIAALGILDSNYNSLNSQGKIAVDAVDTIVVSAQIDRSFVDVDSGTFYMAASELVAPGAVTGYVAAQVLHDGGHIALYNSGHHVPGSVQEEIELTQLMLQNASALQLTSWQISFLQQYMANQEAIEIRISSVP